MKRNLLFIVAFISMLISFSIFADNTACFSVTINDPNNVTYTLQVISSPDWVSGNLPIVYCNNDGQMIWPDNTYSSTQNFCTFSSYDVCSCYVGVISISGNPIYVINLSGAYGSVWSNTSLYDWDDYILSTESGYNDINNEYANLIKSLYQSGNSGHADNGDSNFYYLWNTNSNTNGINVSINFVSSQL